MTKAEFIDTYGVYRTLSSLCRSDFQSRNGDCWSVLYKNTHIRIEYDRLNHWWLVSSDEISYCRKLIGSFEDIKNIIRHDVTEKIKGL